MSSTVGELAERIREAAAAKRPLRLRGGGTKDFYGGALAGDVLDTRPNSGIVAYEPTELVVTARCGTPLAEIEAALAARGQMLAFEPPHFGAGATLGGCVAAGLSGPRRASAGAVRDFVLGARILDGRGRELAFGGQVMKNVAGYDVSRLLAGSLGTLGLILEASIKVLPRPPAEATLSFALGEGAALERMTLWAGRPLPVSATAWQDGELRVRLSGSASAVRAAIAELGGERAGEAEATGFWAGVREHTGSFFSGGGPLWRVSLPSHAPRVQLAGSRSIAQLIEWGGALRWLRTDAEAGAVRAAAAAGGGHATLFRGGARELAFTPLDPVLVRLHRGLKAAFDPAGILNPGRLYPGL
jgi:glycolate oxidase FAD binding subunit